MSQLEVVLEQGWASTIDELEVGLTALAAPLRDGARRVVAAVSVSGPSYRLTPESFGRIAPALVEGADEISARLGYYPE
jgi:DNA-binding IclR family transcriptional regulator